MIKNPIISYGFAASLKSSCVPFIGIDIAENIPF
jgi:hypothetical protein